jgi:hypothetical protein
MRCAFALDINRPSFDHVQVVASLQVGTASSISVVTIQLGLVTNRQNVEGSLFVIISNNCGQLLV